MPDTTLIQLPFNQTAHLNKGLFADHFLDKVVPEEGEWKTLKDEARPVFEALRAALRNLHPETLDEGQLEERWIKAVFDQIGWYYNVQVKIRFGPTGYRKPDYALTAERNQANALDNHIYVPRELSEAGVLAVADAKKW